MQKALDRLFKVVENIAAVLLYVLTAVAFFQLISRYFFHKSNAGVDELVRLAFVWVVSFGSALAFRAKAHLGITALLNKLSADNRKYANIALDLILVAFFALVISAGIGMARMGAKQYSEYLRMSMAYFYACIPVGAAISILVFMEDIWRLMRELRDKPAEPAAKGAV